MNTVQQTIRLIVCALVISYTGAAHPFPETSQLFFEQPQYRITDEMSSIKEIPQTSEQNHFSMPKTGRLKEILFASPYKKVLTALVAGGAFALTKMTRSAWLEHSNKQGTERISAVLASLKDQGLDRLVARVRGSSTVHGAVTSLTTELVMGSATKALTALAQLA